MSEKNLEGLLNVSLENIKGLVDSNSIIGSPITTPDGTTIIPVSKVSFGFASGGSDFPSASPKEMFGGGSGGGVTIQPMAFPSCFRRCCRESSAKGAEVCVYAFSTLLYIVLMCMACIPFFLAILMSLLL